MSTATSADVLPGRHGGDVERIARTLGVDPSSLLDLSASLNPVAPDITPLIGAHLSSIHRYPDASVATRLMAGALGAEVDQVLLTNGGAEAISLLAAEIGGRVVEPEFALHPRWGEPAPLWRSNPHNPTGRLAAPGDRVDVWDEAFYPLATGRWTKADPNALAVVGSLTKVFACPGLRLGYVMAPPDLIASLRTRQPEWSVGTLALAVLPDVLQLADEYLADWATRHRRPPHPTHPPPHPSRPVLRAVRCQLRPLWSYSAWPYSTWPRIAAVSASWSTTSSARPRRHHPGLRLVWTARPRPHRRSQRRRPRPAGPCPRRRRPMTDPTTTHLGQFDAAARDALRHIIEARRDVRRRFIPAHVRPVPDDVLHRVLEAAHKAPSVGLTQPWDFLIVTDHARRLAVAEHVEEERQRFADSLPPARARTFGDLKVEAIKESALNLVVTSTLERGGAHVLGRFTQPDMAHYSTCLAIENLWLTARAEGLGVGWVSFYRPSTLSDILDLPPHVVPIAYLCMGYVEEFRCRARARPAGLGQAPPA